MSNSNVFMTLTVNPRNATETAEAFQKLSDVMGRLVSQEMLVSFSVNAYEDDETYPSDS